jgi:type VI secretion system Hcp family effector
MREKRERCVRKMRWLALGSIFALVGAQFPMQEVVAASTAPQLEIRVTIPGVTDGLPEGVIIADSFSWGMAQAPSHGAGSVKVQDFAIKKLVDMASPSFFQHCASGAHYPTVKIEMRKAGSDGGKTEFLRFTLTNVLVSSVHLGGSPGSEGPEESITFVYGRIAVEYQNQGQPNELECTRYPVCVAAIQKS